MVFATVDRKAAFEAIRELRGRTIELFGLLRALVVDGADRARVRAVQAAIAQRRPDHRSWSVPPDWWASWVASPLP